jgi:hypothetical protein
MIDYAYPCMMAENALKDLHNAAIEGRMDDALEYALVAMAEARLTYQALRHMQSGISHFSDTATPALTEGVPGR